MYKRQPLDEPTDLLSGETTVFTWKTLAAAQHGNAVTVVASTADGTDVRVKAEGRLEVPGLLRPVRPAHPVRRWLAAHRIALAGSAIVATLLAAAVLLLFGGCEESVGEPIELTAAPNGMSVVDDVLLWVSTRDGTVGVTADGSLRRRPQTATKGGSAIAALEPYMWVPIPDRDEVVQLDAKTGERRGAIDSDARPKAIALSSGSVYVSQSDGTATWVQRYDAGTRQEEGDRITVPQGTQRLSVREGTLWVLVREPGEGPDRIVRYDTETRVEQESIDVGSGARAMAHKDGAFWVTSSDSGTVTRVDAATLRSSQFKLGGQPANVRVGLGGVWVTNPPRGVVQRLDPETREVTDFKVGRHPYSLAITRDGVWVGDTREDNIRLVKP